jgi:hydrogenase large subunit
MAIWINELLKRREDGFYRTVKSIPDGEGAGMIQAARGALGHWVKVQDGKISHYQIITPTSWNGSPRDGRGVRGAWEEALIGTPIKDIKNPVEAGHVVRSFDPCLVCAVHCLQKEKKKGSLLLGFNR